MIKLPGLLLCTLLLTAVQAIFAQTALQKDSTVQAIFSVKNDSVRTERSLDYLSKLIVKKSPLAAELKAAMLKNARQQNDSLTVGRIYSSAGFSYLTLGEFNQAYSQYFAALPIMQKYGKPRQLVRLHQDMMWIQFQLKDYDKAEKNLLTAQGIAQANKLKDKEAEVYNMFGILYDSQLEHDKAVAYYRQALELNKRYGTKFNEVSSLVNLAISERRMKSFPAALKDLYRAKTISDSIKNDYYKQAILQNIGELAYDMKDYDTAEKYILQAFENSKNNSEPVLRTGLLALLKNISKQKGDYKSALLYADSLAKINNAIFSKEKIAQTREIETKYQSQLKDQQLEAQALLALQQQQELELKKRQLQLSSKENELQDRALADKQRELKSEEFRQASLREKQALLYKLNTKGKNNQIARQQAMLNSGENFKAFLIVLLTLVGLMGTLFYYSYDKTKNLNNIIVAQKQELVLQGQVKDRIFSVVSHDMRAPINTLLAFTQLLEYGDISADNLGKYSSELNKSLLHTSVLMDNLLNWASSQMQGFKPQIEIFDVNMPVTEVMNSLQTQALLKGISIQNNIPSGTLIKADINMMQLVLRNLVSNSIKYSHANGQVALSVEQTGHEVNIYVKDEGTGMSDQHIEQFNSSNYLQFIESTPGTNKEKGTGLGLVLCKNFTTLMNGEIYVKSERNKGSVFALTLPKAT